MLGSGSVITDENGWVYQTLAYAPFGETLVSIKNGSYDEPYKFTGYERDEETGFDYAHQRYYWSDLGVFLSVDPLSHLYPHMSSYAYCGNNPVTRIDPDGKKIVFLTRGADDNINNTYVYRNGNFFDKKGNEYKSNETLNKVSVVFDKINSSGNKELINMLNTLDQSKNTHYMEEGYSSYVDPLPSKISDIEEGKSMGTSMKLDLSESAKKYLKKSKK